ncbi:BppU family phage baseplate upper protein [Bacillus anthracis]|uniref:BppU family phage baseplate upper protein n=1 Tax=Bacillus anthracis TaxID=1392 RepID=UPI002DBF306B|nr:BppU family phage baseplate upper protein [Bacillus anthracis]MEB9506858.1 BppU family phage baseplate upper protein [Bacillus anthracis]
MTFKTRELTVDLINEVSTNEIRFSQGDKNSAKLVLNITNLGEELDLSKAKAVRITFEKQDGKIVFQQDCQPINAMKGKYQIVLKTQTLAAIGNVLGQVTIFEDDDREIDSQMFVFTVKRSLSGNEAVESTNEFTIIAKALELGEKFKDVDFDPIIKAGELAAGALPKTGGTMTGTLTSGSVYPMDFKGAKGQPNWTLRHLSSDGSLVFAPSKTPEGTDWDWTKQIVFHPVNGLQIFGGTNLYKKTDLYPSWLNWNGYTFNLAASTDLNTVVKSGLYGGSGLVNAPTNIYLYVEVIAFHDVKYVLQRATSLAGGGTSNQATWVRRMENGVWGAWERLFDSKGGTLTGNIEAPRVTTTNAIPLVFNGVAGASKSWKTSVDGKGITYTPSKTTGVADWDDTKAVNISTNGEITATKFNTLKDGRATPTLTADAENPNSGAPLIAERRGNTVTVSGSVRRKVGASGDTIATLPADMRPSTTQRMNLIATDGTVVFASISSVTGNLALSSTGKEVYMQCTYVVD